MVSDSQLGGMNINGNGVESKRQLCYRSDLLIAAHALCQNGILVANNPKHSSKVKDLRMEEWS
jgi:predicted nucleic acid-binding protein